MPELPDILVYLEALEQRILGERLEQLTITAPFLLRTAVPPIESVSGRKVIALRRLGKRIAIGLEDDLWLVLHLMIAGRLHWREQVRVAAATKAAPRLPAKNRLATFEFNKGVPSLTEAGCRNADKAPGTCHGPPFPDGRPLPFRETLRQHYRAGYPSTW